jgi:hypothetical protein
MYRVAAIVCGAVALAGCSSTPDWMSIDALKPAPAMDTVRFETNPPGAEAKAPNGQSCHTPCALALPTNAPMTISFALNGYLPTTETIEPVAANIGLPELRPNPVQVDLSPAPPPKKKPTKKPATRTSGKTSPKPAPANTAAPAPAAVPASQATPQPPSPAMQPAPSPWPATPPPTGQ